MMGARAERMAAAACRPNGSVEVAPVGPRRSLDIERYWTQQAGAAAHVDVADLIEYAERRAGDGAVRDLRTRDFAREVREELADARNYLCWLAEQASTELPVDDELIETIGRTLESVTVAFGLATKLRLRRMGA